MKLTVRTFHLPSRVQAEMHARTWICVCERERARKREGVRERDGVARSREWRKETERVSRETSEREEANICMHAYIHTSIQMHAYIHAYIHTYTRTYACMYIQYYIHPSWQADRQTDRQTRQTGRHLYTCAQTHLLPQGSTPFVTDALRLMTSTSTLRTLQDACRMTVPYTASPICRAAIFQGLICNFWTVAFCQIRFVFRICEYSSMAISEVVLRWAFVSSCFFWSFSLDFLIVVLIKDHHMFTPIPISGIRGSSAKLWTNSEMMWCVFILIIIRDWQDEVAYQNRLSQAEAEAERSLILLEHQQCGHVEEGRNMLHSNSSHEQCEIMIFHFIL